MLLSERIVLNVFAAQGFLWMSSGTGESQNYLVEKIEDRVSHTRMECLIAKLVPSLVDSRDRASPLGVVGHFLLTIMLTKIVTSARAPIYRSSASPSGVHLLTARASSIVDRDT